MAKKKDRERRKKVDTKAAFAGDNDSRNRALKLPENVSQFKFGAPGVYLLDVVPYTTGKNNPKADAGYLAPSRHYLAHGNVGPGDLFVCCPKTFGEDERCPICEHGRELLRNGDRDGAKEFRNKQRLLMGVLNRKETDKGVQILDSSHFKGMGEAIAETLDSDTEGALDDFWDPEEGMTMKVSVKEEPTPFGKFNQPKRVDFIPRKKPLSEDVLDAMPCLDELLVKMSYAELKKLFEGKGSGEDDDTDLDADDENGDNDECPCAKGDMVSFKYKGKKLKGKVVKVDNNQELVHVKCDDRDEPHVLDWNEGSIAVLEAEDEVSSKKKGKKDDAKKKGRKRDEDEEEDDDEDDSDLDDDDDDEDEDDDDDEEEVKPKKK